MNNMTEEMPLGQSEISADTMVRENTHTSITPTKINVDSAFVWRWFGLTEGSRPEHQRQSEGCDINEA